MAELDDEYRSMFDSMAQGAFCQLPDGSLAQVNAAALAMLGLTREAFLGRTFEDPAWRVIAEDGTELLPADFPSMAALRTGQPVRDFVAGVHNHRQQSLTWLNINAIPLFRDGEAAPYKVLVTLHDISDQKRLNDVHLSRIHLMQFADSHSLEELLVEVLNELERLTGSAIGFYHFYDDSTATLILTTWSSRTQMFCNSTDNGGHYRLDDAGVWVDCIRQRQPVIHNDYSSLPHRRGLPNGHVPVLRELVVPVKKNGRIVAILGVGNKPTNYTDVDLTTVSLFADLTWDITESKKGEALLLEANRKLETLTSTTMEGYFVTDRDGGIVSANETACLMHGYSLEELLSKTLRDLEVIESDGELRDHIRLIEEQGYDRFESRHRKKDGGIIDVELSVAYLPGSGFLSFTRDITEKKRMQAELLRNETDLKLANELLEQRVSQRTADLQAAIREQESFSYSVSHDLRAPLRHINSYSALLMEEYAALLPVEARYFLERMRAASNRMGAMIDHLLELSRVVRTEIKAGQVDMSEIANATLRMFRETEPHRKVEQSVEPGLVVLGDHHLLNQLLGNLLGNAWKYTSREEPARIEFGKTSLSGEETYFVKDNGAGFDMTYQGNLFKVFERLHGSEFEGVGIGLATAQRIVQRHGGRIWAVGIVGEGAVFYFTLRQPGDQCFF